MNNYPNNTKEWVLQTPWFWSKPLLFQIWQNSNCSFYCIVKEWVDDWVEIVKSKEDFIMNVDKIHLEPKEYSQYRVMLNAIRQLNRREECKR
jgi:hypothetical protein